LLKEEGCAFIVQDDLSGLAALALAHPHRARVRVEVRDFEPTEFRTSGTGDERGLNQTPELWPIRGHSPAVRLRQSTDSGSAPP